ncbi:MAG: hypothetical protein ACK5P5_11805, partial [Pseudobdellovibrionaceae bacterium]
FRDELWSVSVFLHLKNRLCGSWKDLGRRPQQRAKDGVLFFKCRNTLTLQTRLTPNQRRCIKHIQRMQFLNFLMFHFDTTNFVLSYNLSEIGFS